MTTKSSASQHIAKLVHNILSKTQTRSEAFKNGVLYIFNINSGYSADVFNYTLGTPEADAFEFGKAFGEREWKELARKQQRKQACEAC